VAAGELFDEAVEVMDREELLELQLRRLRVQVDRCCRGRLFREKLAEVGAQPGDVQTLEDLRRLPFVTKDELREDQAQDPPFGSLASAPRAAWREVHPSTGTTGAPVNTIWTAEDVRAITDVTARTLWQFGVRPAHVVQNAFAYGLWVAGLSCHYAAQRIGATVIPAGASTPTERQIAYLADARSDVLLATPSYALYIAEQLEAVGLGPDSIALSIGCFGGEPGASNPSTRQRIEAGLGIRAFDYYGLAEIGPTFASECEAKAGLHFAEDHVVVECVDAVTGEPVPDGRPGVLVFTHLQREGTPLLRYCSNDLATLTRERCPCGRTHVRAAEGIIGRQDDLLIFKGAKFYPTQVEKVVRRFDGVGDEFAIEIQREREGAPLSSLVIVVERRSDAGERSLREAELIAALRAELGVTPRLRVEPPGALERTAFKAQRIFELTAGASS